MSGYVAGHSGKKLIGRNKTMRRAEVWMKRWGAAGIFVFALIPFLPLDIAGLAAGALRYSIWKFLVAAFLGKTLLYVGLTYATAWGWDVINGWFG
jgi:membrane protein YqaA with SNARE-associated domain